MRAIIYANAGDASVLQVVERPLQEPAEGEVRIRVVVSGINPTDWKSRSGAFGGSSGEPTVPSHDGAGVVDVVGPGVAGVQVGDRVWMTLAADGRPASGTAQEYTVVPAARVFPLPDGADFELGSFDAGDVEAQTVFVGGLALDREVVDVVLTGPAHGRAPVGGTDRRDRLVRRGGGFTRAPPDALTLRDMLPLLD